MLPSIHFARRYNLALVLLFGVLIWAFDGSSLQAAKNLLAVEQAFNAAEQEPVQEVALRRWKGLLEEIAQTKSNDLPGYISADIVQRIIIDRELQLYVISNNEDEGVEAYEYINRLSNKEMRLWGLVYFLQQVTQNGELKNHPQLFTLALDAIDTIYTDATELSPEMRERVYYGLVTVLTGEKGKDTYPAKELQRVHELITQIQHSQLRLDLMRRFGAIGKSVSPIVFPASFQRLYLAFADDYPEADVLTSIHQEAVGKDQFNSALYALLGIKQENIRTPKLTEFFQALMDKGDISRARRVAEKTDNPPACVDMWSRLMQEYFYYAYDAKAQSARDKAVACTGTMKDKSNQQQALQLIQERETDGKGKKGQYVETDPKKKQSFLAQVDKTLAQKGISQAAALVKGQSDTKLRVNTFYYLAQRQAASLDRYGFFKNTTLYKDMMDPVSYSLTSEATVGNPSLTLAALKVQEDGLIRRYSSDAKT